jgi:radical SAM superfamily enzyme YgiQ (UPF0313 family)
MSVHEQSGTDRSATADRQNGGGLRVVLISTYELGHQPFGLASPAAWLRSAGHRVTAMDLSRGHLDQESVCAAELICFYVPMHTATRMAIEALGAVKALNPAAHLCFYGLYAPVNEGYLRQLGAETILGGEFEPGLLHLAHRLLPQESDVVSLPGGLEVAQAEPVISLAKQSFLVPDRRGLPALADYASVAIGDERRVSGYTEASRGCKHMCRHCPVVPVYGGRFRIVAPDVVLADIDQQVRSGARHITFGDPDFFNGPTHAIRVLEGLHAAHPQLSYDVTIKVEHLLRHAALLPDLRRTGCLFVTSAVESIDDRVLTLLDKHHTGQDFIDVVRQFDAVGLTLNPTFVTFHPWLTVRGYRELLALIDELELVDHVASVQLAIRLLIPAGSRLLELDEIAGLVDGFEPEGLSYTWSHPDGRVDALFEEVMDVVESGVSAGIERREIFDGVWRVAREADDQPDEITRRTDFGRHRGPVPHMTEPWFCCSEPLQRPTVADPAAAL